MDIPGYKIIQPIKNTGVGDLYLATQMQTGKLAVVKCLPKSGLDQAALNQNLSRFLKEGEAAKRVLHPNIARTHLVGHNHEQLFSVSDYVSGDSLAKRAERLCLLDKIYIVKQLANALDYLQQQRIGHYNIKPANIILADSSSGAVLTDFGFARGLYPSSELMVQEKLLETADYASPEALRREPLDACSDLYSLGAIFCFLLTGKAPAKCGTGAVGTHHLEAAFVDLPEPLSVFQTFVDYALAKMPDERFQSGQEMIEELDKIDDETIISLEGYQLSKPRKTPAKSEKPANVVSLSKAVKKKQQHETFRKLLEPKDPKPAVVKSLRPSLWDELPPGEFENSYDFLDIAAEPKVPLKEVGKKAAAKEMDEKQAGKKSAEKKSIAQSHATPPKLEQQKKTPVVCQAPASGQRSTPEATLPTKGMPGAVTPPKQPPAKSTRLKERSSAAAKTPPELEDMLADLHRVDIPTEVYSALAQEPWPTYELEVEGARKDTRRALLLFLLLLCSVVLYFSYRPLDHADIASLLQSLNTPAQAVSEIGSEVAEIGEDLRGGIQQLLSDKETPSATAGTKRTSDADTPDSQVQVSPSPLVSESPQASTNGFKVDFKQERVQWLLEQAEVLRKEGKLLFPADRNALVLYREVLQLSPENFAAINAMQLIREDAIEQIRMMLELNRLDAADALLTRLNIFYTPAPPVGDLALEIRKKRQELKR